MWIIEYRLEFGFGICDRFCFVEVGVDVVIMMYYRELRERIIDYFDAFFVDGFILFFFVVCGLVLMVIDYDSEEFFSKFVEV